MSIYYQGFTRLWSCALPSKETSDAKASGEQRHMFTVHTLFKGSAVNTFIWALALGQILTMITLAWYDKQTLM
jgi:hypothetical protein